MPGTFTAKAAQLPPGYLLPGAGFKNCISRRAPQTQLLLPQSNAHLRPRERRGRAPACGPGRAERSGPRSGCLWHKDTTDPPRVARAAPCATLPAPPAHQTRPPHVFVVPAELGLLLCTMDPFIGVSVKPNECKGI